MVSLRSPVPSPQPPSTVPFPGAPRVLGAFRQVSYRVWTRGPPGLSRCHTQPVPRSPARPLGPVPPGQPPPVHSWPLRSPALLSVSGASLGATRVTHKSRSNVHILELQADTTQHLAAHFVLETQPADARGSPIRTAGGWGCPWTHCGLSTLFLTPGNSVILFFTSQHMS